MIPICAEEKVAETGVIPFSAQAGQASWVLREELAKAAAHVLTTAGQVASVLKSDGLLFATGTVIARPTSAVLA